MRKIAPYVSWGYIGDKFYYCDGSKEEEFNRSEFTKCLSIASKFWRDFHSEKEVRYFLSKSGFDMANIDKTFEFLKKDYYFINQEFPFDNRYSRPMLYYNYTGGDPIQVQRNIENSHVTLIGAGGIGNLVSAALVGSGVGSLAIVDDDLVEGSNLSRQIMFRESDIGVHKLVALKRELEKLNSNISVNTIAKSCTTLDDFYKLPKTDLIVLSADYPSNIAYLTNKYAVENDIPFINVGYINDLPTVGPFVIPRRTACWSCGSLVAVVENIESSSNEKNEIEFSMGVGAPSHAWTNMVSSGLAVDDILSFLGGYENPSTLNKRIGFDKGNLCVLEQELYRDVNCKICGKKVS